MNDNFIPTKNSKPTVLYFDSHSFYDLGIILKLSSKEESKLLYATIEKVFIKKYKFSIAQKLGMISMSTVLFFLITSYFILNPLMIIAFSIGVVILIKNLSLRWYYININLFDGAFYKKRFFLNTKQDHIELVNKIRNGMFNYRKTHELDNRI